MADFSKPTAIPARLLTTAYTAVVQVDCMVDDITVVNNDTVDRTVSIKDGAGLIFEPAFTVPAGTRQQLPLSQAGQPFQQGKFFSGGILALASAGAVVSLWPSARTQP